MRQNPFGQLTARALVRPVRQIRRDRSRARESCAHFVHTTWRVIGVFYPTVEFVAGRSLGCGNAAGRNRWSDSPRALRPRGGVSVGLINRRSLPL